MTLSEVLQAAASIVNKNRRWTESPPVDFSWALSCIEFLTPLNFDRRGPTSRVLEKPEAKPLSSQRRTQEKLMRQSHQSGRGIVIHGNLFSALDELYEGRN